MRIYPESAAVQLEFDKVQELVANYCKTAYALDKAGTLRIHTARQIIERELKQTHEYTYILRSGQPFPNDFSLNISKDIKLLGIPGAMLAGEQWGGIRKLLANTERIFRWFDAERRIAHPQLSKVLSDQYYEKIILEMIGDVLDEQGVVVDNASPELSKIRQLLYRRRNELRRVFDKVVARLNKAGYTADIEESFSTGRRVVAVTAEHKRQVKGILHGESDSRRTSYIEPEETIELNNEVFSLENEEREEVVRILRQLTAKLSVYSPLLEQYMAINGEFDFIAAKARLANDMNAQLPALSDKAIIEVYQAYHPLLVLYHKKSGKPTIPVDLTLNADMRILVISGPNAGGKTVSMKTIGLCQLMLQAGLLVPVQPHSTMGIFRQLFIHIGDTQSIEFELSTYSSHLLHMKHFIENANGKTLFFIDELGSGSDPSLGGAFAEVIMEELARRHSMGIVTTHYLNLKVMANHTRGILNGAMAFDEETLQPKYRLMVGKPGSSYTFSIAERIGLPAHLIARARKLVETDHFKLDKLLNRTEQDLQKVSEERKELNKLLKENERLQKEMKIVMDRERHRQQVDVLKQQNLITQDRMNYLKETERKLRHLVLQWKKEEDKEEVIKQMKAVLFQQKEFSPQGKRVKKLNENFQELKEEISVGSFVKIRKNHQVGEVKELRGKRAIVQIGVLPIQVEITDLVVVAPRETTE